MAAAFAQPLVAFLVEPVADGAELSAQSVALQLEPAFKPPLGLDAAYGQFDEAVGAVERGAEGSVVGVGARERTVFYRHLVGASVSASEHSYDEGDYSYSSTWSQDAAKAFGVV